MELTDSAPSTSGHSLVPDRPQITLSFAQSLDGSIAARRGSPLQISTPESLLLTHQQRADHDGILIGIGTVLADNPRLTVRLVNGPNPIPIILDSKLRFPHDSSILKDHPHKPLIATTPLADEEKIRLLKGAGAKVLRLPADNRNRVELEALLKSLARLRIRRVMVEGGAEVITAFLAGRWVDRVIITISPALVGGLRSIEALLDPITNGQSGGQTYTIEQFPQLTDVQVNQAGRDLILSGTVFWQEN